MELATFENIRLMLSETVGMMAPAATETKAAISLALGVLQDGARPETVLDSIHFEGYPLRSGPGDPRSHSCGSFRLRAAPLMRLDAEVRSIGPVPPLPARLPKSSG